MRCVRKLRLLGWLVMVLLAVMAAGEAQADGPSYVSLIDEGLEEYQRGNWQEAYVLFEHADRLQPNARTQRGMGMVAFEMRRYATALKHLEAAIARTERPLTRQQRKQVEALLARTRRLVGTVVVSLEPAGATLLVNGEPTEERTLRLSAGEATLKAQLGGHHPGERRIQVAGGQRHEVQMRLQPVTALGPEQAAVSAEPDTGDADILQPVTSRDEDEGSLWSSPFLWLGVGGVVAAGVVAAVLLSQQGDSQAELPAGTLGVRASALEPR